MKYNLWLGWTVLAACVCAPLVAQPSATPETPVEDPQQRLAELAGRYANDGQSGGSNTPAATATATAAQGQPPVEVADIEETPLGLAAAADGGDATQTSSTPTGGWVLSTLAALGVVIGMIFAARWAYAKLGGKVAVRSSPVVEVLSRTTVAPKNQVLLLRVGQRVLVVGDSSSGLRTLANIDDPEEVASLLQSVTVVGDASVSKSFSSLMARFNSDYDAKAQLAEEGGDTGEVHIDRTRDSLSGLTARLRSLGGKGGAT